MKEAQLAKQQKKVECENETKLLRTRQKILDTKLKALDPIVDSLQSEVDVINDQISDLIDKRDLLESKLSKFEIERNQDSKQYEEGFKRIEKCSGLASELQSDLDKIAAQLNEVNENIAKDRSALDRQEKIASQFDHILLVEQQVS